MHYSVIVITQNQHGLTEMDKGELYGLFTVKTEIIREDHPHHSSSGSSRLSENNEYSN